MLGLDWAEIAIIAVLALIFVGPKELPGLLRNVARWVNKARSLAREFQSGVDEMIREAELDEARKSIEAATKVDLKQEIEKAVDPTGDVSRSMKIEPPAADAAPSIAAPPQTPDAATTPVGAVEVAPASLPAPNGALDEPISSSAVPRPDPAAVKASEDA